MHVCTYVKRQIFYSSQAVGQTIEAAEYPHDKWIVHFFFARLCVAAGKAVVLQRNVQPHFEAAACREAEAERHGDLRRSNRKRRLFSACSSLSTIAVVKAELQRQPRK